MAQAGSGRGAQAGSGLRACAQGRNLGGVERRYEPRIFLLRANLQRLRELGPSVVLAFRAKNENELRHTIFVEGAGCIEEPALESIWTFQAMPYSWIMVIVYSPQRRSFTHCSPCKSQSRSQKEPRVQEGICKGSRLVRPFAGLGSTAPQWKPSPQDSGG